MMSLWWVFFIFVLFFSIVFFFLKFRFPTLRFFFFSFSFLCFSLLFLWFFSAYAYWEVHSPFAKKLEVEMHWKENSLDFYYPFYKKTSKHLFLVKDKPVTLWVYGGKRGVSFLSFDGKEFLILDTSIFIHSFVKTKDTSFWIEENTPLLIKKKFKVQIFPNEDFLSSALNRENNL